MLTERQQLILQAIVADYIMHGEPVGSRTISKHKHVGYSSATIRNEMADLEELGYLEQPYTSAGRIPSHQGYRFYVDNLMRPHNLDKTEIFKIRNFFTDKMVHVEEMVQRTATILSSMTNYTSIVLGPEVTQTYLKQIQFVPLSENMAVAILILTNGHVENRLVRIPSNISGSDMERLVRILNDKLTNLPISEVQERLHAEVAIELQRNLQAYQQVLQMLDEMFVQDWKDQIFLGGMTNILMQPEFQDVHKVKALLDLLEQRELMVSLLYPKKKGISVRIGTENSIEEMANCSMITATYNIGGRTVGTIGILGPTRMEYERVIGILDFMSDNLSYLLDAYYRNMADTT
ncbi:heat-inducible transcriptional repressor HrcA [Rubeoparvulum massiliense]|uniref:heat-inducible transcriptional repressor HrcA n=1 Tax=Rubeoparvulum massiliense TaxID=1631346 RepID=UPI00065E4CA2|nr:heat-inducible transcriptional repressor HrcA [Rubeoparvulum massiliense]